jgi:hypothetical protein
VEEAQFRDGTYLLLHSGLIENNTKISYTGNITDNSTIEGKMAILKVIHMVFRGQK